MVGICTIFPISPNNGTEFADCSAAKGEFQIQDVGRDPEIEEIKDHNIELPKYIQVLLFINNQILVIKTFLSIYFYGNPLGNSYYKKNIWRLTSNSERENVKKTCFCHTK